MTVTIDNIPVYDAVLSGDGTGMLRISLVDEPAVCSNFQHFKDDKPLQLYRIQDEDQRLVRGVVMRADFPIYRRDKEMGEYYIIYKADTIREMAEKYLLESRQNMVNLMHEDGSNVEGVQMVQYFLKDSAAGISPEGFDDIADGSLFAEFHVTNDEVWDAVKDGTYKGFSLEGIFDLKPERDRSYVQEVVDAVAGQFAKLFKITNMGKLNRVKSLLAKVFQEMASVTTDKGVLAWDGDDDLKAGDRVYITDANGERSDAADGEYHTDDGKTIVVADGLVAEIRDAAAEVAPEEGAKQEETLASVATDKGTLEWNGEEDLKAGDEVFVTDEEGNRTAAPDGDYVTDDGKTIRVADGKVSEIVDDRAEVDEEGEAVKARKEAALAKVQKFEESYDEKYRKIAEAVRAELGHDNFWVDEAGDDFAVVFVYSEDDWSEKAYRYAVTWNEDGSANVADPVEVKKIWVPIDFVSPFEGGAASEEMEALRQENAELKAQVETLKKTSAAEPLHDVVKTTEKYKKTGNKGLDRVAYLMSLGE